MNILGIFLHNTDSKSVFNIFNPAKLRKTGSFELFPPSFPHCFRISYFYNIVFHTYKITNCIKISKNGYNTNILSRAEKCGKAVENA